MNKFMNQIIPILQKKIIKIYIIFAMNYIKLINNLNIASNKKHIIQRN